MRVATSTVDPAQCATVSDIAARDSPTHPSSAGSIATATRNRVLRNTYALLALSMVPTVLGAWIGVSTGFSFFAGSPFIGILVFLGVAFGFFFAIDKFKNSPIGVGLLLAFTFFMGLMLSRLVGHVLGFSNGGKLIATAFGGTAAVFCAMAMLASVIKRDLSSMGKFLTVGAVILLVAVVANIFLQSSAMMLTIIVAMLGLFSAFLLYDLKRIMDRSANRSES
jgi:FtsH-binding integral membrane protein